MYHVPQIKAVGQAQRALSAVQAVQQGTLGTAANIHKGAEAAARAERELQEQWIPAQYIHEKGSRTHGGPTPWVGASTADEEEESQ